MQPVCFLTTHSISSMFHRTLPDPQFSSPFSTSFSAHALGSSTSPSLLYPSMSPSAATLQGGLWFGRLAEQSPLTGYEPKALIEVSSEHTPVISLSRRGSLDTNVDDLATPWIRLKSATVDFTTFFLKSAKKVLSHSVSLVLRHIPAWRNPGEILNNFQDSGNGCRKMKESQIWRVCRIQMKRERALSEQRDIHDFLERKADHAFQGECAVQTILSEAQSELDRRMKTAKC